MIERTGMHGLPNVYRSSGLLKKMFWLITTLFAFVFLIWQVTKAIMFYYSYPTTTKFQLHSSPSLPFPAVSFCNLNPIRSELIENAGPSLKGLLKGKESNRNGTITKKPTSFFDWNDTDSSEEDNVYSVNSQFLEYYSTLPKKSRIDLGYNITNTLLACSIEGKKCGPKDFKLFNNYFYGLTLTLFIDQSQYIKEIAESAGIQLVVHDPTDMPFPEDKGVAISPGKLSFIGFQLKVSNNLSPPYGICNNFSKLENQNVNAFWNELSNISYTEEACMRTCYQKRVISRCDCADPRYNFHSSTFKSSVEPCKRSNTTQTHCKDKVELEFSRNSQLCQTECPAECVKNIFEIRESHAQWPSLPKTGDIIDLLQMKNEVIYNRLKDFTNEKRETFVSQNVLKVHVYYSSLTFLKISREATYQTTSLLSDLGGQVGLWLGFSVITIFEFFELALDSSILLFLKCKTANKKQF
ncbi:DgyrCDS11836 [Dimorphilus gyrociliatus]|uniref:DgyrCDS11836 n=1 Tax=Dimorphilus gyrociliatus TaxID=2664684 RepID=A0A7I8W5J9_9ANNE|nr:DgyrCDS11836 [Dimorphilus gyrociliatus]